MKEEAVSGEGGERITPGSVSQTREGTPDRLRRRLEGDLDNIVLMALRKEPQRRYASAEQFSEDISRHLGNLPVIARPDTAAYRTAKFVARHKVGVAAAALLIATMAAGITTTAWQARMASAESKRSQIEAAKAQRINSFLQDMLSFSSPAYGSSNPQKNPDAKVSEVVEQAARRADTDLQDQPEVLAEMQRTIGGLYYAQGRYDQAEQLRLWSSGVDLPGLMGSCLESFRWVLALTHSRKSADVLRSLTDSPHMYLFRLSLARIRPLHKCRYLCGIRRSHPPPAQHAKRG